MRGKDHSVTYKSSTLNTVEFWLQAEDLCFLTLVLHFVLLGGSQIATKNVIFRHNVALKVCRN